MFDAADRFASDKEGVVALVIILPSASPPDGAAAFECAKRLRNLGRVTRRQVTVAVGGGVWRTVVLNVHRAIMRSIFRRSGRLVVVSTVDEGISQILEMKTGKTPSFDEIRDDVHALFGALEHRSTCSA